MFSSLSVIFSYSLPPYLSLCPSLLQENTRHCASKWTLGTHTHTNSVHEHNATHTAQCNCMYTSLYVHAYLLYLKMHTDTQRERNSAYSTCVVLTYLRTYMFRLLIMSASHFNCRIFCLGTGFGSASSSCSSLVL